MEKTKTKGYRKPTYVKTVEEILREYPVLKKTMVEVEPFHYPSCTTVYEERIGHSYSEYVSSTEKFGIRKADKQLQMERTEQALGVLSLDERKVIEGKYFDSNEPSDEFLSDQLNWSRSNYYRIKRRAIRKVALAFHLI